MALQIWLPLNDGTLENRGLSTSVSITTNGATVNVNGKTGSCYYFDGTKSITLQDLNFINGASEFSIALWTKTTTVSSTQCLLNYRSSVGTDVALFIISGVYRFDVGGTQCTFSSARVTTDWTHIACTFNRGQVKIYVNGTLVQTTSASNQTLSVTATKGTIGLSSTNTTPGSGNAFTGYIDDYRLYDHCLSAKEVKELSKGLILNYKLDDEYIESTANLGNTSIDYHNMTYRTAYATSSWGGDAGTCTFYSEGGYNNYPYKVYHKTATGSGGIYIKTANDITIVAGKTYTMSVYVKASRNFTESSYSFNINGVAGSDTNHYIQSGRVNFTTDWQRLIYTFTAKDADAGTYGEMGIIYNDEVADYYVYYSGFQIEEGDHATPFVNGSRNNTIVYDCSGYGNHGTVAGTPVVVSGSGRYMNSYKATDSASCIQTINLSNFIHDGYFSMSIWFKRTTGEYSTKAWETLFGGPSGFEYSSKNSSTNSPNLWAYSWGNQTVSTYTCDEWHHTVMVRTPNDCKFYLDGELKYTGTAGSIPSGNYFFGACSTTAGQNYRGHLSDARIYTTALSADDVLELYQTSSMIDNKQNIFSYEFVENGSRELIGEIKPENPSASITTIRDEEGLHLTGQGYFRSFMDNSAYIPINPTGHTYYYDIEYSNNEGNQFYIGFEKFDANKQSGSNQECTYPVGIKTAQNHARVKGTIDLATANNNPAAFTRLRILNQWSGTTSGVSGTPTIHHISLREVTNINTLEVRKNGQDFCNEFLEYPNVEIRKNGITTANQLLEI